MHRPGKFITLLLALLLWLPVAMTSVACSSTIVLKTQKKPAPRVETKPHKPGPKAVWVRGHWKGRPGHWTWVPGHWRVRR